MSGQTNPDPTTRFFGGLLMGAGILLGGTAGLCSVAITIAGLLDAISTNTLGEATALGLPLVLLVGGIPCGVGIGLFFIGRKLFREKPANSGLPPGGAG